MPADVPHVQPLSPATSAPVLVLGLDRELRLLARTGGGEVVRVELVAEPLVQRRVALARHDLPVGGRVLRLDAHEQAR